MLDFRKGLLALAVAGLGIVGTASAQVTCSTSQNASGAATSGVRVEGTTEQLQTFQITGAAGVPSACSGTTNTSTVAVTVTSNVPFTNVLLTGTTSNQTDAACSLNGGAAVAGTLTSPTTISCTFTGVAIGAQVTSINASNLRVNAWTLAAGSTVTLTAAGVTGIITSSTAVSSAITQKSIGSVKFIGFGNVAVCTTTANSVNAVGVVQVTEGFTKAFTTAAQEFGYETASGATALANNPVTAGTTVGTTLAATFGGLAGGVTYYLPTSVTYTNPGNTTAFTLTLVSGPTSTTALAGGSVGSSATGGNIGNASGTVTGVYGFTPTNGSFTAYYMVTSSDPAFIDQTQALSNANNPPAGTSNLPPQTAGYTQITLFETVASAIAAVPTSAAPTVSVVLAGNTSGYPQFSSSQTPVTATGASSSSVANSGAGILTGCNTTLLFPYIANVAGYDTGIAISNASTGTSVPGNAITAQNGTCTLTYYGGGATANSPLVGSPVTIPAGTTQSFLLSNAEPGFVGYAVASCTFQGGHGFAFITDGFGGGGRGLSQGYLAVILQNTFGGAQNVPNGFLSVPETSR